MISSQQRGFVVAGILLGVFLSALEATVISTAMPTIVSSLGGLAIYSLVFSGYLFTSTLTMPLWGRLADLYGPRKLFVIGVSIFMFGSALCGASHSMIQLILFRLIQGIGAGAVLPLTFTMIGHLFDLQQRAKMQGFFSGVWGVASVIGPLVGGYLSDHVSWRWVFYLNVPFGLLSMFLVSRGKIKDEKKHFAEGSLNLKGTLTFALAVVCLLLGLMFAKQFLWVTGPLIIFSGLIFWLYIHLEKGEIHPLIPLKLFKIKLFRSAQIAGFFCGMAMFGTLSFVPLFMQSALGSSAVQAGRVLLPFMMAWVVFSILASRLILKVGYRNVVICGSSLLSIGFVVMSQLHQQSSPFHVMVCMALEGAGMGFSMAPFLIAVQNAVPKNLMGAATSSTQFVRTIGGAIGVAVMGVTFSYALHSSSNILLKDPSVQLNQVGKILQQPDQIIVARNRNQIPPEILYRAQFEMGEGLQKVFRVGLFFAICSLIACFTVPYGNAHDHTWKSTEGE